MFYALVQENGVAIVFLLFFMTVSVFFPSFILPKPGMFLEILPLRGASQLTFQLAAVPLPAPPKTPVGFCKLKNSVLLCVGTFFSLLFGL